VTRYFTLVIIHPLVVAGSTPTPQGSAIRSRESTSRQTADAVTSEPQPLLTRQFRNHNAGSTAVGQMKLRMYLAFRSSRFSSSASIFFNSLQKSMVSRSAGPTVRIRPTHSGRSMPFEQMAMGIVPF
jgi:hypothetical protein